MQKTIQLVKRFVELYATTVRINEKYLKDIIKETGYTLKSINNPFVYMESLQDFGRRFLISCDYLSYKRNSEQYKKF